jgi:hypothetical protein
MHWIGVKKQFRAPLTTGSRIERILNILLKFSSFSVVIIFSFAIFSCFNDFFEKVSGRVVS